MRSPARPTLSRRERDRLRQRAEILNVALRLFVEKGYHDVSMREIADAAEFATGTLYRFFESKEALFRELVRSYAQRISGEILAALDVEGDERAKISRFIRVHIQVLAENAPAVRLYFRQVQGFAIGLTDPDGEVTRVRETILGKLAAVIAAGERKGLFRDVVPERAAVALSGLLQTLACTEIGSLTQCPVDELAAFTEELVFSGIATGTGAGLPHRRDSR